VRGEVVAVDLDAFAGAFVGCGVDGLAEVEAAFGHGPGG
jgi:hypothetical protein